MKDELFKNNYKNQNECLQNMDSNKMIGLQNWDALVKQKEVKNIDI